MGGKWNQLAYSIILSPLISKSGVTDRLITPTLRQGCLLYLQTSKVRISKRDFSQSGTRMEKKENKKKKKLQNSNISKFKIEDIATSSFSTSCDFSTLHKGDLTDWVDLTQKEEFKNWLKICLGLKVCLDFMSPIIQQAVTSSYDQFQNIRIQQNFQPLTREEVQEYRESPEPEARLRPWVEKIMNMHRSDKFSFRPKVSRNVFRYSDPTKWMSSEEGPWEIARVYMTRDFALPPENKITSFDTSALLRYIAQCKSTDQYFSDVHKARQIAYIRNDMMHCPGYQCSNHQVESSFERMFDFINDYQSKTFEYTNQALLQLNEVKQAQLAIQVDSEFGPDDDKFTGGSFIKELEKHPRDISSTKKKENKRPDSPIASALDSNVITELPRWTFGKSVLVYSSRSEPSLFANRDQSGNMVSGQKRKLHAKAGCPKKTIQPYEPEPGCSKLPFVPSRIEIGCSNSSSRPYQPEAGCSKQPSRATGGSKEPFQPSQAGCSTKPSLAPASRKRKFEEHIFTEESGFTVMCKRRRYETLPFDQQTREKSTKSGRSGSNGGNRGFHQKKLKKLLCLQNENFQPTFHVEMKEDNLFYATVEFKSLFAAINQQPRYTEEDAIEAAAIQALKQQGIQGVIGKDPCKILDTLCRQKTGLPPVYYLAPFLSGNLYVTTLQIINNQSLEDKDKIYFQTAVSKSGTKAPVSEEDQRCAEEMAAKMSLIDSFNLQISKSAPSYKQALNEHCLMNGLTLPYYRTHLYTTTVTSLARKSCNMGQRASGGNSPPGGYLALTSYDSNPDHGNNDKHEIENEDGIDLCEVRTFEPMRSVEGSEQCAARLMIDNLSNIIPGVKEETITNQYKAQLNEYAQLANWPLIYHTDKITTAQQPLYDCVVVSKGLDINPYNFHISCDGRGRSTAYEAREIVARKAIFMLGLESNVINNK